MSCVLILGVDLLKEKELSKDLKARLNLCHVSTQGVDVVVHLVSFWPIIPVASGLACLISLLL